MSVMKKSILLGLLLLAVSVTAQAQNFALIDMEYILKNIPAYATANKQLEQASKEWQAEVDKRSQEAKSLYEKYQTEAKKLSADQMTQRENEIVEKEKEAADLRRKYFGPEGELAKKRNELMRPIQDAIYNAVKEVAMEASNIKNQLNNKHYAKENRFCHSYVYSPVGSYGAIEICSHEFARSHRCNA